MTQTFPKPDLMPAPAPLAMKPQVLEQGFQDQGVPEGPVNTPTGARLFVFGFATLATIGMALVFADWFLMGGINGAEVAMIALIIFTFFWIALSVASAILGCLPMHVKQKPASPALDVAILMPIFGEPVSTVFTNLKAMLIDLEATPSPHNFRLFILSDTRDPARVTAEYLALAQLQAHVPGMAVHYRHRAQNTGFKAGNIQEWVQGWGGAYDAMLVLDSDSIMSGQAIVELTDELAADPKAGLIQTVPRLIGAQSLFARLQQFANTVYGGTLARGLTRWSGNEANYWGHNAIMRVQAFATCAGLPVLPGRAPFGGPVLSHDFVEAALLRRAGWHVKFLPQVVDSYETTPSNLIAHVARDRRWCQGNLQHLRIVGTAGLKQMSRFHLIQGAMAYIVSLGWFGLLALWMFNGMGAAEVSYFSAENPYMPVWPEMDRVAKTLVLVLVYGMLIAPKLIGAAQFIWRDPSLQSAGGWVRFWISWCLEVLFSVLLAPTLMIQHIVAVLRTVAGFDTGWRPVTGDQSGFLNSLRFHVLEVLVGALMAGLFAYGLLSFWLLPIAVCLILAPVLSALTALTPGWCQYLWHTPQETNPPELLRSETPRTGIKPARPGRRKNVPAAV